MGDIAGEDEPSRRITSIAVSPIPAHEALPRFDQGMGRATIPANYVDSCVPHSGPRSAATIRAWSVDNAVKRVAKTGLARSATLPGKHRLSSMEEFARGHSTPGHPARPALAAAEPGFHHRRRLGPRPRHRGKHRDLLCGEQHPAPAAPIPRTRPPRPPRHEISPAARARSCRSRNS